MDEKLPYYMAYPMPLLYDDERQNQRDYEYMKSVYPGTAKRLIPYIEEECDRLEYTGSVMYEAKEGEETGEWLQNLIQVMTYQELCQRRRENRSMRRKYY